MSVSRFHVLLTDWPVWTPQSHLLYLSPSSPPPFRAPVRQVILTDLTAGWREASQWDLPLMAQRHGDVAFKVLVANGQTVRMRLRDYVDYVAAQHNEEPLYIFDPRVRMQGGHDCKVCENPSRSLLFKLPFPSLPFPSLPFLQYQLGEEENGIFQGLLRVGLRIHTCKDFRQFNFYYEAI